MARGWRQTANFLVTGALIVAFSHGVRLERSQGASGTVGEARLLGLSGVGLIGAGLFATDPVFGYPSGSPLLLEQKSLSGHLHNLASLLFFAGVPGACYASFRRAKGVGEGHWAIYSLLTIPAMLITFVLAGVGFAQRPRLVRHAGVIQRLSITTGLAWIALRAVQLRRASRA